MAITLNVQTNRTNREKTMMKHLNRISLVKGFSIINIDYLGSTINSDTWKYEFYYGSPEYHNPDEFGEITVRTK